MGGSLFSRGAQESTEGKAWEEGGPCPEGTPEPISWEHLLQEVLGLVAAAVQGMDLTWMFAPSPPCPAGWRAERRGGSTGTDGPWLPALLSGAVPPACNRLCTKQLACDNSNSLASLPAALRPFCSPVPCPPPASPGSPAQPQTPQILQPGLPTLHLEGFPVRWCLPGELRAPSAVVHLQFSFPGVMCVCSGLPPGEGLLGGHLAQASGLFAASTLCWVQRKHRLS